MEDYEDLDRAESLCGAVPEDRQASFAELMFAAGIASTPYLLVAVIGGFALLGLLVGLFGVSTG